MDLTGYLVLVAWPAFVLLIVVCKGVGAVFKAMEEDKQRKADLEAAIARVVEAARQEAIQEYSRNPHLD